MLNFPPVDAPLTIDAAMPDPEAGGAGDGAAVEDDPHASETPNSIFVRGQLFIPLLASSWHGGDGHRSMSRNRRKSGLAMPGVGSIIRIGVVLILVTAAAPCFAQQSPVVPPDASKPVLNDHELLHKYVWSTLGLEGALDATLASGLDQWRGKPPEWDLNATGYAQRWVSEYAESAIGDSAKYAVARLFHHDPSFTRCACSGFARRLRHAVDSPFMARTRDGTRVLSAASLAGFVTGHVVSASTWYPAELGSRDGVKHAGMSLISKIGMDVLKEFWRRRSK